MSAGENKAVFLSYASQDAEAVLRLAEALRAAGVEVWFDKDELVGGDAWDAKIRGQIAACALFVPVISANTQARLEGYFRLEWKLAAQRTHTMADEKVFLLPVVIDDTRDGDAKVPAEFKAVQWTRLAGGDSAQSFCARVSKLLAGLEVGGALRPDEVSGPKQSGRKAPPTTNRRGPVGAWVLAGLVLLVAVGAWLGLRRPATPPAAVTSRDAERPVNQAHGAQPEISADARAVVVLPFSNLSGDVGQEYISDGLTEEILNALARERDLRVVPRSSAFSFKGRNVPLTEIARILNVGQVVEGSVRRAGNRVRILSTITRVSEGSPQALPPVEADLGDTKDVFALQEKVARAIVMKITRRDATVTPMAVPTKNAEAYDEYLRGREKQTRELVGALADSPAPFYERAVKLDPDFGLAWARLAAVHVRAIQGGVRKPEIIEGARHAIERALKLQPGMPEALIVRGTLASELFFDFASAARDLAQAEAQPPATAELRISQSRLAAHRGEWDLAVRRAREGVALDPQNGDAVNSRGLLLTSRGLFAEADGIFRAVALANHNSGFVRANQITNRLAWRGAREAMALLNRLEGDSPNSRLIHVQIRLLEVLGESATALKLAEDTWSQRKPGDRAGIAEDLARLRQQTGNTTGARAIYEELRANIEPRMTPESFDQRLRLGTVLARLGETARAVALIEAAHADLSRGAYWLAPYRLYPLVEANLALGRIDRAIQLWERSMSEGFQPGYGLRQRPEMQPLLGDARFQDLVKRAEAWAMAQPAPKD